MVRLFILAFFVSPLFSFSQLNAAKKIWIDTDNCMGKPGGDVDDGLALMLALADTTVELCGISTVHHVRHAEKVTMKLLNWYGKEKQISVHAGAKDLSSADVETPAVKALAAALMKERLTIVALGPATNIAALISLHPEVIPQIEQIVFCMGRSADARFQPGDAKRTLSDYNFELAPDAVRQILKTKIPVALAGYEAASSVFLSKEDIRSFKAGNRKGDKWVYRQLCAWHWKWKLFLGSKQGFIPFDAVTMGFLLAPEYLRCERDLPVTIEQLPEKKNQLALLASGSVQSDRKADYCGYTQVAFKEFMLGRLLKK